VNLVIGFGNTLRGDDGVGQVVAELVRQRRPDVQVLTFHQLVPELAERISRANVVVFIDADPNGAPGSVHTASIGSSTDPVLHHSLQPSHLMGLARDLGGSSVVAWLVRVSAASFDFGAGLSPQVFTAVPAAARAVQRLIPVEQSRHSV